MNLAIDDAGKDMKPGAIDYLTGACRIYFADLGDTSVDDRYVALAGAVLIDDNAAAKKKIKGLCQFAQAHLAGQ